jgi:hypothetical protein
MAPCLGACFPASLAALGVTISGLHTCAVAFNPIQNFRFRYSASQERNFPCPDGRCVNSMAVAPRIHETGTVHGKNGIIMHGWPCDTRGTFIAGSALT